MVQDRKRFDGMFWRVETISEPHQTWFCVAKKDSEREADMLLAARASWRSYATT